MSPDPEALRRYFLGWQCRIRQLCVREQGGQRMVVRCVPRVLTQGSPDFEATYWHNLLSNPTLPPAVTILGLEPDWDAAKAQPPVT